MYSYEIHINANPNTTGSTHVIASVLTRPIPPHQTPANTNQTLHFLFGFLFFIDKEYAFAGCKEVLKSETD